MESAQALLRSLAQLDVAQSLRDAEALMLTAVTKETSIAVEVADLVASIASTRFDYATLSQSLSMPANGTANELLAIERIKGILDTNKDYADHLDAEVARIRNDLRSNSGRGPAA